MVKYVTYAIALKVFSCGAPMRRLYRLLGNHFGSRRRARGSMPDYYVERVGRMVELARTHGIVKDGSRVLELGSGWLHWEAMTLRLFFDIEAVLFDVWDNRQLSGLKNYIKQLGDRLMQGHFGDLSEEMLTRARNRINTVLNARSFDELYEIFGFRYVIDNSGSLSQFSNESFDLVVSGGVLEHVRRDAVAPMLHDTYRLLRRGGWALHGINIADHLSHYDRRVSPKFYLSIPEWAWRGLVQNEVQYINRLQKGEWMFLFREGGFDVVSENGALVDITGLKLAKRFRQMNPTELQYTSLRLLLRKT